jgi:tRNA dimethylallyltransferase
MDTNQALGPLIIIVGQTASGKSNLAMLLAKKFDGEIISGDSRHIYKTMDIGTDKPTLEDQKLIRHHLINTTTPDKPISAAKYKKLAQAAINDISVRGKLPILVGGSGLYIDSVIFDFNFDKAVDLNLRNALGELSVADLQELILKRGLDMPTNNKNKRHLTRELESGHSTASNNGMRANTLIIGFDLDSNELKYNVTKRVRKMFDSGLEQEVIKLSKQYGWEIEPMKSIGYREFMPYINGDQDLAATEAETIKDTLKYAKRQKTWFKRNKDIQWVKKQGQAVDLVTTLLNK